MSSIMTNAAAMTALQSLQATTRNIENVQARISTGYEVAEAADNAAYWSIATTMRSDNSALATVQDALGLGAAKVDVTYTALNKALNVVDDIKTKLVAASEPGVDKTKINKEITALKEQLQSITKSASFSGENWLHNTETTVAGIKSVVGSFTRDSNGLVTVETLDINVSTVTLTATQDAQWGILTKDIDADTLRPEGATGTAAPYYLLDIGSVVAATGTEITINATTTDAEIENMIRVTDNILTQLTDAASDLGATKKRIDMQSEFVDTLMDAIERGIGQLVDADMSRESTRLQALQVQQQLGIQALSIANGNAQTILALFQN